MSYLTHAMHNLAMRAPSIYEINFKLMYNTVLHRLQWYGKYSQIQEYCFVSCLKIILVQIENIHIVKFG